MSNFKHRDIEIIGFEKQGLITPAYYGDALGGLQRLGREQYAPLDVSLLRAVAENMRAGKFIPHPMTSDHYSWLGGVLFRSDHLWQLIAVPEQNDTKFENGTRFDRHVALFSEGRNPDYSISSHAARHASAVFVSEHENRFKRKK